MAWQPRGMRGANRAGGGNVFRDSGPTGDIAHDGLGFAGATQVQHIHDDAGEINGDTQPSLQLRR